MEGEFKFPDHWTPLQKKVTLIFGAKKLHGEITPTVDKKSLMECFTEYGDGYLYLWFNDKLHSTGVVKCKA